MKKITTSRGVSYQQQKGIVIGNQFLTKDNFAGVFADMLEKSEGYANLRFNIAQARKIITIIKKNNNSQVKTITEFTSNLEEISRLFSEFMGGLGGNISLLTTFNLGEKSVSSYFLMKEDDLPSRLTESGEKQYINTKKSLQKVQKEGKRIQQLNKSLNNHLNNFYEQLAQERLQTKDQHEKMKVWSYYNLPNRYKYYEKNKLCYPISLSQYFWGKGHLQGYAAEAFGAHLALIHPNALVGQHIKNLKTTIIDKPTVIDEHGGAGSIDLFNLLASTKGNVSSQLSGDIVVIDSDGNIKFNIQSKASKHNSYNFTITYKQFLQNMMLFLDIYEKYASKGIKNIKDKDIDALFNAFATEAWIPISKELSEKIDKEINDMLEKGIPKKKK